MSEPVDVWRPAGADGAAPSPVVEGRAAYGEGLWINQAFSPEVAFRIGVALLRERPGLVLGGGALAWFLFYLPNLAALPMSVASEVVRFSGGDQLTGNALGLGADVVALVVYLFAFPFQWVFVAGILKAMARHIEADEGPAALVWGSWREGLFTVLYRLLSGLILSIVLLVILLPAGVAVVVLASSQHLGAGLITLGAGGLVALVAYLYVLLPLALGVLPCAIDGAGPLEALRIAWRAGSGARPTLFVFALVFAVLAIAGACVFCVGGIAVYGLTLAAAAGGWLLYARPSDTLADVPFFRRHPMRWL